MTLKTRRFLFLGLFIVFIPLSIGVILYSNGWRFNFDNFSIKKTGAIYIETNPKGVSIKLDNKIFPDKSGFIQSGTLISNLVSKNYQIKIEKENYHPYFKDIKVEPSLVSEIIDIILIPKKIKPQPVISAPLKGLEIIDLSNAKKIIVKNGKKYYLYNLENQSALNVNASFENFKKNIEIKKVAFHPFDQSKLIIEADNIYSLNIDRLKLEPVIQITNNPKKQSEILAWTIKNSQLYYIKETAAESAKTLELFYFNFVLKTENSFKLPENIASIVKIGASENNAKIAILDSFDDIYEFNLQNQNFEKIAHNAKDFQFSPDEQKIAFLDKDGKINVLFFKDVQNIKKKTNDVIGYNLKTKESIKNVFWHKDSSHLFIEYLENNLSNIEFIEIDDRLPLNQYSIFIGLQSSYYNLKNNFLYFTKENKLYSWEL
ncbi:hypothetical protein A2999_02120 [Candidatus Wolfebacteria bacterium RIFCSPLOWO2_01_FULL_38_11]|uniref:PEGA domain-containing protein n=2 Tax=Candidatus Wolfeibacteriota TaxID=1752735 RepID=A0A0G0FTH4_9BACT|nr:MAG: hypothetical protein US36_C0008G0010 [Candidatus Wolfebacteria bacterium GW2011_GWC1_37_10]OGM92022.1 MAG: hypothetical protein A2999_02120 [Candidatus Wolfebacteria bacterium RIFCSPLOWO2_01_FULL_38_11]